MKTISISSKFKKDYKKVKQYPAFKEQEFKKIIKNLQNGEKLEAKYNMHKMVASGVKYQGYYNVHIKPNIILICNITDTTLELYRIGSHNDLGLTESI